MADEVAVGDLFAIPEPDGFGALQVTAADGTGFVLCLLDWFGTELPGPADLAGVSACGLTHHAHQGDRQSTRVGPPPINHRLIPVGNGPVDAGRPTEIDGYASWSYLPDQLALQRQWDRLPAEARAAYHAPDQTEVSVDFGAGPVDVPRYTYFLRLDSEIPVPATGPVSWGALESVVTTNVTWAGTDRGFAAALAYHPLIDSVYWHEPPPEVDLRPTHVTSLWLWPGAQTLHLPRWATECTFMDAAEPATATALDDGYWLRLQLNGQAPRVPAGLHRVRELRIDGPGEMSLAGLAAADELVALSVYLSAGPGRLDTVPPLPRLRNLMLSGAYGLAPETLPDLPSLRHLIINGIPRSAVAAFRARYRGTSVRLTIRGAKSDVWLRGNLDNPFREWVENDDAAGKAACKAYATALRDMDRTPADAEAILLTFIQRLNRIDERYSVIDTLRREEAADAFAELAARAFVSAATATAWLDEWREF